MPAMQLTPTTTQLLNDVSEEVRDQALEYLALPMFAKAFSDGTPMQWWASTQNQSSWMDISCDEKANVSIAFKTISRTKSIEDADPQTVSFARPLPKKKTAISRFGVAFRRMHAAVGNLAFTILGAGRTDDMKRFLPMMQTLAQNMPWVDHMNTLAQRMHGDNAGPHLFKALASTAYFGELVDEDLAESAASPFTTVQALVAIHATRHTGPQTTLYALNHPSHAPLYLLVRPEILDKDGNCFYGDGGTIILLDHQGTPLFMNITHPASAKFCDMSAHQEPLLNNVRWQRTLEPGAHRQFVTDYAHYAKEGYNQATQDFVERLTHSDMQALDHGQVLDLVFAWAQSPTSTQQLWHENEGKESLQFIFEEETFNENLPVWTQWATEQWGQSNPKDYAMLQTLMPPMDSLDNIDAWRHRLAALAPTSPAVESYTLPSMDEPTP